MYTIIDTIRPTDKSIDSVMFCGHKNSVFVVLASNEINEIEDLRGVQVSVTSPDKKVSTYKALLSIVNPHNSVGVLLNDPKQKDIPRLSKLSW